jgi:tetratricopeptide (TPR) repeat protein
MKRLEEAGQSAQKALSLKPDSPMTCLLLADIHLAQKDYPAQLRDVEEYLRLDPNGAFSARAQEIRANVQRLLSRLQSPPIATQGKP